MKGRVEDEPCQHLVDGLLRFYCFESWSKFFNAHQTFTVKWKRSSKRIPAFLPQKLQRNSKDVSRLTQLSSKQLNELLIVCQKLNEKFCKSRLWCDREKNSADKWAHEIMLNGSRRVEMWKDRDRSGNRWTSRTIWGFWCAAMHDLHVKLDAFDVFSFYKNPRLSFVRKKLQQGEKKITEIIAKLQKSMQR